MPITASVRISKLEAARRQLEVAIELWFYDSDPVSIHTLAAAAYQITRDIKKRKGIDHDLLYDTKVVKPEYRKKWINAMKEAQNFFKHADTDPDPDGTIELHELGNVLFIMVAAAGLRLLGAPDSYQVGAFLLWLTINKPEYIKPSYLESFRQGMRRAGIDDLEDIRAMNKSEFFDQYMRARMASVSGTANASPASAE